VSVLQSSRYMPLHSSWEKPNEPTFVRLRYFLGGDRPSQTTSYTLSPQRMSKKKIYEWFSKIA